VQSKTATLTVGHSAAGARAPIARARSIRMVAVAAEPRLSAQSGWRPWGAVLVKGSAWHIPGAVGSTCNGRSVKWPCGVDVHSNNWSGWPLSPDTAFGPFGSYKWQCVELIERFVNLAGFYKGIIPAPGNAQSMYGSADSHFFVKHPNGSGYRPVPGDIVVYRGGGFGHISIVESDDRKTVVVLEQNVKDENGRGVNTFQGKTLLPDPTWAGFSVIGFLHAKANEPSGPPIAIGGCGARGEGAPPEPGGVCTLLSDGSQRRQITKGSSDSEPAWSPDRKQIAFVRLDSQGASHIFVVDADGGGTRELTSGSNDRAPAWSPGGRTIAFSQNGQIALLDVPSGGIATLTPGPRDYDPSWSADGSLIAFSSGTAPAEIDVMGATGTSRYTLVSGAEQPAWAPSGTTLAFTRFPGPGSHIAVIDGITGAHTHNLTSGPTDDSYSPTWSPNGKQIAFGRGEDMENPGVWVMNADGSHQSRVFGGFDPAW
jgi:hypothetical protein